MNWQMLMRLIPVVAGAVNPIAGMTLGELEKEAERIIAERQAADPTLTRDAIIQGANDTWAKDEADAAALRQEGNPAS